MNALTIRDLRKTYPNGFEALKGISMDVSEGDFFALLGPNGAGKSTTIGIVCSLVNKSGGSVSVFGHDLDRERDLAKRCIGLVPQEINFNQFEQVMDIVVTQAGYYGIEPEEAGDRAEACLRQLGLWEKRDSVSRTLSGGMKRRLMIARALVHSPRLLMLDEPTAGVDIEIRRSMWEFLEKLNQEGTTIILTTHYLEEAESLCRHIGIIDHGQLVEMTNMATLLADLHTESFVLNLTIPVDHLPDLVNYHIEQLDPTTLVVDVRREQDINDLFRELTDHNLIVSSLRNKSNRLEQLFMRLLDEKKRPADSGSASEGWS
ncbi:MAG: ABC transporter ATP-binding protein [Pseudomonadota bacterium]|jgi:ABC-2 type transport system ATP-binding protein|nr:ABC transporter ATP-binding protein [Pseudomonadota bacterium]